MDISNAILAKSDQINAIDLTGGPQTVTITEVKQGNAEQPVSVITDVFGPARPFKPSKTVLRILANAWGVDTAEWTGRSMTLYRDPTVRWAGEEVGGIRIKALSHIDKSMVFVLPTSKGKTAKSTVTPLAAEPSASSPLTDTSGRDWMDELAIAGDDLEALLSLGVAAARNHAPDDQIAAIRAKWSQVNEAQQ